MSPSHFPENELLKTVLRPLLEDFQYWFSRSQSLLEAKEISFLSNEERTNLLARLSRAQQEVSVAQMLLQATDGQAGIETATLVPWHQLVAECWQISQRWRSHQEQAYD